MCAPYSITCQHVELQPFTPALLLEAVADTDIRRHERLWKPGGGAVLCPLRSSISYLGHSEESAGLDVRLRVPVKAQGANQGVQHSSMTNPTQTHKPCVSLPDQGLRVTVVYHSLSERQELLPCRLIHGSVLKEEPEVVHHQLKDDVAHGERSRPIARSTAETTKGRGIGATLSLVYYDRRHRCVTLNLGVLFPSATSHFAGKIVDGRSRRSKN